MRPDRFCNYVYAWSVARVEDRADFDTNLLAPLPGQRRRTEPSQSVTQSEGEGFMEFMSAVTST